jgi:uncharacterized membrane protein required for colicin V production
MNWLDAAILLLFALGAFFGAVTGAFWQAARVAMVAAGALASMRWGGWAAAAFENRFSGGASAVFGYGSAFLLVYLALFAVSLAIDKGIREVDLKWLDRGIGAAVGGLKALIAVVVVLVGLSMYPTSRYQDDVRGSLLGPILLRGASAVLPPAARDRARSTCAEVRRKLEPVYSGGR